MGRYAIILVAGFAVIIGVVKLKLARTGRAAEQVTARRYEDLASRQLAHGGLELCLLQLKSNPNWRAGYAGVSLGQGTVNVSIVDATLDTSLGLDTVRISSTGISGNTSSTVQAMAALSAFDWPVNVNAGVTARCNVSTLGNMTLDGRDHDLNGNLIANNGVNAISTTMAYNRGGNSKAGGTTDAGVDVAPTKTGWGPVVDQWVAWPSGYPTNPDMVMGGSSAGFPDGTLKSIAQSGYNGSQYVTNPGLLTYPLAGVTYVESSSGSTWGPVAFGTGSTGVLVVHNSACNAAIKNLNSGTFKGLLIADDIVHVHTDIIGAVFVLTTGPSEGNCIGNGNGNLLFSREAVSQAAEDTGGGNRSVAISDIWE